jgi:hypothetical protein
MKLHTDNHGFQGVVPSERIPFKIATNAKMFTILSDGIYKDKILAVIRELSCNAFDAHYVAGQTSPFKVQVPTILEPTFAVIDEGTGIDPEKISDIFWTYGTSSKTECNNQIGALGLGSKSPFAYTKSSFIVKNRYKGKEHTYFCFINEQGMPDGSEVSVEDTEAHSGISVELAVRREDIDAFKVRVINFFQYWEPKNRPTFINGSDIEFKETPKVFGKDNWYLAKKELYVNNTAKFLMGGIVYPIDLKSIPSASNDLLFVGRNNFVIECPIGSLSFQVSREELSYEKLTIQTLESMAEKINNDFKDYIKSMVEKDAVTPYQLYQNFHQVNKDLKSVNLCEITGICLLHNPICNIFNHGIKEFKTTMGDSFSITHLNKYSVDIEQNGYSSLNIMMVNSVVSKTSRFTLKNEREVTFQLPSNNLKIVKPWYRPNTKPSVVVGLTPYSKTAANLLGDGLVPISTLFHVCVSTHNDSSNTLTFILNDKGVLEGQKLYREYLNNYKHDHSGSYLVSAEDKRSDHGRQEIETMLKGSIFEGCPIILLSSIKEIQELSIVSAPVKDKTVIESPMLSYRGFYFDEFPLNTTHLTRGQCFGVRCETYNISSSGQLETERVDDISNFEGTYVIKKDKKISQEWLFETSNLAWLMYGGLFDKFSQPSGRKGKNVKIYILTEKMVSQLTKGGAKLTNAYDVVHDHFKSPEYISRMEKYKDLIKYEDHIASMDYEFGNQSNSDSRYYNTYIGDVLSGVTSLSSFFKSFIEEIIELKKELKVGAKLRYDMVITKRFAVHYPDVWEPTPQNDDPNNPVDKLFSQYPLLNSLFSSFMDIPSNLDTPAYRVLLVKEISDYINLKDKQQNKKK